MLQYFSGGGDKCCGVKLSAGKLANLQRHKRYHALTIERIHIYRMLTNVKYMHKLYFFIKEFNLYIVKRTLL